MNFNSTTVILIHDRGMFLLLTMLQQRLEFNWFLQSKMLAPSGTIIKQAKHSQLKAW